MQFDARSNCGYQHQFDFLLEIDKQEKKLHSNHSYQTTYVPNRNYFELRMIRCPGYGTSSSQ